MYKLVYPGIRVRTAPPVSVRVRVRVSVIVLVLRCNAIAHTVVHNSGELTDKYHLPTKFQVCSLIGLSFIRSKDIERYQKIRKWVTEMK